MAGRGTGTANITIVATKRTACCALGPSFTLMGNEENRAIRETHALGATSLQFYISHREQEGKPQHSRRRAAQAPVSRIYDSRS